MTRIRAIPSFICVPTRAAATTAALMQVPVLATDFRLTGCWRCRTTWN